MKYQIEIFSPMLTACRCYGGRSMTYLVLIVTTVLMIGCDGGLVGTGNGPSATQNIPLRVSARMPRSLLASPDKQSATLNGKKSIKRTQGLQMFPAIESQLIIRNEETTGATAQSWALLSPMFTGLENNRIALQLEMVLLNSVFSEIENRCATTTITPCRISPGELSANYDDARAEEYLHSLSLNRSDSGQLSNARIDRVTGEALLSESRQITFGEIIYEHSAYLPYENQLTLSPMSLLPNQKLVISWSNDFKQVQYEITNEVQVITDRYLYQQTDNAERLTIQLGKNSEDSSSEAQLEIVAMPDTDEDIFFNAQLSSGVISGRASDRQGLTSFATLNTDTNELLQEVFITEGEIVAAQECEISEQPEQCFEITTVDGEEMLVSTSDVQNTITDYGFKRIIVSNLPESVRFFQIRSATPVPANTEADVYCDGWRSAIDNSPQTQCIQPPEIAITGIVYGLPNDDEGNEYVIDDAVISIAE